MRAIRDSALDPGDGGVTDELPVKKIEFSERQK